jgi:carbon monoxide dehydrogenase subunit G
MVKLAGTHEFDAPKEAVWEALLDPDVLSRILPGCKQLDRSGENEFKGEINIRVGPVQGSFNGTVNLKDIDPPNSYRMELAGQGRPGYVKGAGALRLEGDAPTTLHYDGDAQLSGRIASVGQRLVDSTARSLTRQGLQSLESIIAARLQPPEPEPAESEAASASNGAGAASQPRAPDPPPQPDIATPSTMEVGINVARDVATDLAQEFKNNPNSRRVVYVLAGFAAIVWMWRLLFGKAK